MPLEIDLYYEHQNFAANGHMSCLFASNCPSQIYFTPTALLPFRYVACSGQTSDKKNLIVPSYYSYMSCKTEKRFSLCYFS